MLWIVAYLYPVFVLSAFYGIWLCAWVELGHMPRPYRDDPKGIGGIVEIAYFAPAILIMVGPLLTPLGFFASFFLPCGKKNSLIITIRFMFALLYVAFCFFAFKLIQADPGGVFSWYFD